MDISAVIFATHRIRLLPDEGKIPWDEPAFSQRMLENHLSQDHDWASRRLTVIEQQVTWITRQLPAGARILDLGCGPGFYTRLLAERGFHCTGVDFSPASITWARQQAQAANLNIDYIQQDIRTYHPTEPFDFIMMTFGELNVFSAADAQSLISHCAQWLKPDGKLLVEVHTFDEVKRQGMAQPGWQRCPHGLFLAEPHLLLTENAWDEEAQTSSTQFWKDHMKMYKKRPIYWLFSSGKEKAFECLVYLHRYNDATLARMRTEYVVPLLARYQANIDRLNEQVDGASGGEATRLKRERDSLSKKFNELRSFDDRLRHYADMRISIDLDDGVKVNYGKFGDLLADVKAITGNAPEII